MAILVKLAAKAFGPHRRRGDIIWCKAAGAPVGNKDIANSENRFAFVYVTDVDIDDPIVQTLTEDELIRTVEVAPGVFVDQRRALRRLRKIDPQDIPGNAARFLAFHPWGEDGSSVPNNVKYTRSQIASFLRNHT